MSRNERTNARTHERTVVIGGGIAGLTCAWRLHQAGISITLLEQSSHTGGCIRTMDEAGYHLELGPNTFLNSSKSLWDLAESVGLKELKIETPQKIGKTRYVFRGEKLHRVPSGPGILFSSVLSVGGRLRILKEPFIRAKLPFTNALTHQRTNAPDESLASFIERRLGKETLDNLVTPFVSGIYAGDPEKLSVKSVFPKLFEAEQKYGGIFKGMKALKGEIKSSGLGSFKAGMSTLPAAIESQLAGRIKKNSHVTSINKLNNSYAVNYEEDGKPKNILADKVVIATPSYVTADLLGGLDKQFQDPLNRIQYAPIIVIHVGYRKYDIPRVLDGFGFLVPRKNRVRILGCLWSSALFEGRAPEGRHILTNFMGGMLDQDAIDLTNEDIMRLVRKDLNRTMNIKAEPDFACITRYTHAIPQYNLGHERIISKINGTLALYPGLFLTGSYFTGISVAGAIEHAEETAKKVLGTFHF